MYFVDGPVLFLTDGAVKYHLGGGTNGNLPVGVVYNDAYFDMEDGGYHSSGGTNIRANGANDGLNVDKYGDRGVIRRHLYVPNKNNFHNFHFEDFLYIKYRLNDLPNLLYNNKHL